MFLILNFITLLVDPKGLTLPFPATNISNIPRTESNLSRSAITYFSVNETFTSFFIAICSNGLRAYQSLTSTAKYFFNYSYRTPADAQKTDFQQSFY